jgi:hypothetical protein
MINKNPFNEKYFNCISGSLSGLIEVSLTHPLDRIKTKLQENALEHKNISLRTTIKDLYIKNDFYRGFVPRIIGIIPMRLTYWGTLITMNDITKDKSNVIKYIVPGLVAGTFQTPVDNIIEVIKIKLMTKNKNVIDSSTKSIFHIYNKGFFACLTRNIIFAIPVGISTRSHLFDSPFVSGAVGGIIGSILSHPFDVLKTEKQRCGNKYNKYIDVIKDIYKYNPVKFWSGISMRTTLGCVNMGIGFLAFEYINKTCMLLFY